jgi:hypothetical protein
MLARAAGEGGSLIASGALATGASGFSVLMVTVLRSSEALGAVVPVLECRNSQRASPVKDPRSGCARRPVAGFARRWR